MPGIPFVGHWELILLAVVVLLLVGPSLLPRLARQLGGGIREVRREVREITELDSKRDA